MVLWLSPVSVPPVVLDQYSDEWPMEGNRVALLALQQQASNTGDSTY